MSRQAIATDSAFKTRQGKLDLLHVKTLAAAIRRGGALTPITVWRQEGRNSLLLLDGEHRLAAYSAVGWNRSIPAKVVSCSWRAALLIAAGANTKDVKPLTQNEKSDIAWKLVREPGTNFTKAEIARASGITDRTVTTMRARWRTMQGTGREPTGSWWQDRRVNEDIGVWQEMTNAERQRQIEALSEKLRKAVGNLAYRDDVMFAEALDEAFGARLRNAIEYLYGDEVDEWLGLDVSDLDVGGTQDGDEERAPF